MLRQASFWLSFIFLFSYCDRKVSPTKGPPAPEVTPKPAPVTAPKSAPQVAPLPAPQVAPLPPQIADGPAAVALVWVTLPPDEDFYSCGEDEDDPDHQTDHKPVKMLHENHKDFGARTYWVVPAGGTGAWTVVAERPGLFVAVGDRVLEARSTRVRKEEKRPAPAPEVLEDGTKADPCGRPQSEGFTREIQGSGLTLRELGGKKEHSVIPAPKDYQHLETCVMQYEWWVEPVGGLGRYLFLNHRTYTTFLSTHLHLEFVVFDLEKMAPVQALQLPPRSGGWRAVVDDPAWRPGIHQGLKKVIGELGAEVELDPKEVALSHLWPAFPEGKDVGLELAFRHAHECWPCPALEFRRPLDALPAELVAWRKRHPALDAVTLKVPKDRRVAGITVLPATPERAAALLKRFEAVRGK